MVKLTRMFPLLALIVGVVLPVLPAEGGDTEITSGTGTGFQRPAGKTGVTVIGHHDPGPVDVITNCPYQLVLLQDVIKNSFSSDVAPLNNPSVPFLFLFPDPGNPASTTHCIYDSGGLRPRVRLLLGADGSGNPFSFRLEYRNGSYLTTGSSPTSPRGDCPTPPPPVRPAVVSLTTAFTLVGFGLPPIAVRETEEWLSFGEPLHEPCNFLRLFVEAEDD
jgi:hypothetical protein